MHQEKSSKLENKFQINTLLVKPGAVTTGMLNDADIKNVTSQPEEVSREGLCDLETDHLRETAGSMLHNQSKMTVDYTPAFMFHFLRMHMAGKDSLMGALHKN